VSGGELWEAWFMKLAIAVVALVGCVPLSDQPPPRGSAAPVTSTGRDGGCGKTPIAPLKNPVNGEITGGFSDDEIVNATVQFMVRSGTDVEFKDLASHTVVSKRFTGQTIQNSCHLNEYRDYAFRIAVVNGTMSVSLDCWRSGGNEPYWKDGILMPSARTAITRCETSGYTSELDATLQSGQIQGTQAILDLGRVPRTP
jgi:hypothetical protein